VISVADDGYPHVALVSSVVAVSPGLVRVAVGAKSASFQYLRESRKCTIVVVEPEHAFYIKGAVLPDTPTMECHRGLVAVSLSVEGVWSDTERLYQIETGITYAYREQEAQLRTWELAIIEELSKLT
jgi:flavin reductase (DIM6/NTAB) family NADH-FMN oxidoreductase RutF